MVGQVSSLSPCLGARCRSAAQSRPNDRLQMEIMGVKKALASFSVSARVSLCLDVAGAAVR